MADLNKKSSLIGVEEEVTEGTYVAPSAATSYVQPLEDGFEFNIAKELIERTVLTPNIGQVTPRTGIKSTSGTLPVEFRASGVEGEETDFDPLLKGAFGTRRQTTTQTTTKAAPAHTSTVIYIEDADIGDFALGDGIVVLETGSHEHVVVTSVDSVSSDKSITVSPAMSGAPSASVVIAKFTTYLTSNTGHPSLSISNYIGNGGVSQRLLGTRCATLSVDNWTTGQVASFNFGLTGLSGSEEVESSPFASPTFDSGLPPLILKACLYQDGTQFDINNFAVTMTNTWSSKQTTCDPNGVTALLVTDREISGSFDPYKSDSDVDQFTKFDANTEYALIVLASTSSSTTGELDLGTCISMYLPNCITTEKPLADLNDIVQDAISFQATGGASGSDTDFFCSFT